MQEGALNKNEDTENPIFKLKWCQIVTKGLFTLVMKVRPKYVLELIAIAIEFLRANAVQLHLAGKTQVHENCTSIVPLTAILLYVHTMNLEHGKFWSRSVCFYL